MRQAIHKKGNQKGSIALIIRKMQVKTTMRYHFLMVRLATSTVQYWLVWRIQSHGNVWKTTWSFPSNVEINPTHDPAIILLGQD